MPVAFHSNTLYNIASNNNLTKPECYPTSQTIQHPTNGHLYVMYERMMFQKKPTKFAKSTWYFNGMNQKLMRVAAGQIFQFVSKVSIIFALATS